MKEKIVGFGVIIIITFFIGVAISSSVNSYTIIKKPDILTKQWKTKCIRSDTNEDNEYIVPDCIQVGDVLLLDMNNLSDENMWVAPGPHNEHCALYIGDNEFVHSGGDNDHRVCIRSYERFVNRDTCKNFAFVHVKTATDDQRENAIEWAKGRINDSFQNPLEPPAFFLKWPYPDTCFPGSNKWSCSEFIWAAYYNQGIDIDRDEWRRFFVSPEDILRDDDVDIVYRKLYNNTEIVNPWKGIYISNKKIIITPNPTFIFGQVEIEVNATADAGIKLVELYIDDELKTNFTVEPYVWVWDEKSFGGKHSLKVISTDNDDNKLTHEIKVWKFF